MRVLICGAGIAGLALAQRLATHGAEVTVLEKASGPRASGYMIDFSGPGTTRPRRWEYYRAYSSSVITSTRSHTAMLAGAGGQAFATTALPRRQADE
ncbi:FAD-dependent oxidoreductase [Luedemannella flava]